MLITQGTSDLVITAGGDEEDVNEQDQVNTLLYSSQEMWFDSSQSKKAEELTAALHTWLAC